MSTNAGAIQTEAEQWAGDGDAAEARPAETGSVDPAAKATIRILVVEDDRSLRESCASVLRLEGYEVALCGRGDEALDLIRRQPFDIAMLDLHMSQVSGMELLAACREARPEAITMIMTGKPTLTSSIEAVRAGAWDYLPKPFSASHLQILIGRAAHAVLAARQTHDTMQQLGRSHGHSDKVTILGASPAFRNIVELARKVAQTDASVFISGESGTGKEQIAQFIHHHSRRSTRPLVAINCASLPENLLESEMFGHAKGSFTGAVRDKPGLLETADGGTLFLDEITEMSQVIQAKLLRVIQDGVVRRVGSNTTDALVNVRFIAATNRDPQEAVDDGTLRSDLYYRLRVVPVRVPPLRERPEDIPVLARHFLAQYWHRHRGGSAEPPHLSAAAIRALQERRWPGNVRELQNVIEYAVVLLDPGSEVQPQDLPFLGEGPREEDASSFSFADVTRDGAYHPTRERVLAEFEQRYLTWLVGRAGGNMSEAARIAGVDRTTLYRLMEKHGLQRDTIITAK